MEKFAVSNRLVFTDVGTPRGLSRTSREVMTTVQDVIWFWTWNAKSFNPLLHLPALWSFDISVICPYRVRTVKFILICPCFVWQQYLWNIAIQPSVSCDNVELIHVVGAAHRLGKNLCEMGVLCMRLKRVETVSGNMAVLVVIWYILKKINFGS